MLHNLQALYWETVINWANSHAGAACGVTRRLPCLRSHSFGQSLAQQQGSARRSCSISVRAQAVETAEVADQAGSNGASSSAISQVYMRFTKKNYEASAKSTAYIWQSLNLTPLLLYFAYSCRGISSRYASCCCSTPVKPCRASNATYVQVTVAAQ